LSAFQRYRRASSIRCKRRLAVRILYSERPVHCCRCNTPAITCCNCDAVNAGAHFFPDAPPTKGQIIQPICKYSDSRGLRLLVLCLVQPIDRSSSRPDASISPSRVVSTMNFVLQPWQQMVSPRIGFGQAPRSPWLSQVGGHERAGAGTGPSAAESRRQSARLKSMGFYLWSEEAAHMGNSAPPR
jgi:hypothetical protein